MRLYGTVSTINPHQVTGDCAYYAGAQLALQEGGTFAGGGEGQQHGGTMIEGGAAEYASSGDWTKYYDADYACDYYHNFRQVYTKKHHRCCPGMLRVLTFFAGSTD